MTLFIYQMIKIQQSAVFGRLVFSTRTYILLSIIQLKLKNGRAEEQIATLEL